MKLTDNIVTPPKYDSSGRKKRKITKELVAAIKALYAYANLIKARHSLFFRIPC